MTYSTIWIALVSIGLLTMGRFAHGGELPGNFVQLQPVDSPVQTGSHELQPVESNGGIRLFFASNREGTWGANDIWEAVRSDVGAAFAEPRNVEELNSEVGDLPTYATSDGLVLYFMSRSRPDSTSGADFDMFVAWRENVGDLFEKSRPLDEINTEFHEGGASLTADGKTIFFVSDQPAGFGQRDIWVATRENGDDPEAPFDPQTIRNLEEINTFADEAYPSISGDGLTLFWSGLFGVRPESTGGADIWYAVRPDRKSWFGIAVNISALNSEHYDFFPRISHDWPAESNFYFARCSDAECGFNTDLIVARWVPSLFRRGDSNADGHLDIADAVHELNFLFLGGPKSRCADAADANDDGKLDLSDATTILSHLFAGAALIPTQMCALDGTIVEDALGCESYARCEAR